MFTKKIEEMTTGKSIKPAKVCSIIWCLLFFTGLISQVSAQDVSQKKLQILNYFQNATNQTTNRIVSGEFVGAGREATLNPVNIIQQQSGVWLGMIGMDYTNWGNPVNYVEPNRLAKQYWDLGGLVTISAHLQNPTNPSVGPRGRDQIRINEIFQAGTPTNNYWREELRQMADGLTELQNQGVVVLFRPYHEMNGNWFWWGAWENKEDFKRMWRETKSYMENERGLRNLIWVYAPNNSLNGGSDVLEYYAGSDQVDLVGLDIYLNEIDTEPQRVGGYQQLLTLGKPFGFTEYGPFDPVNADADKQAKGAFDYVRLMNSIRTNFPQTTFFQTWENPWSISTNNNARAFLNDPWIANRGEIFGSPNNPNNTHSGSWAMRVQTQGDWTQAFQTFGGVTANRNYEASVWLKGVGGRITLRVNTGEWGTEIKRTDCATSGGWTKCSAAFNTGNSSQLTLVLSDSGTSGRTIYADDVFVGRVGGSNKIPNGGFESGASNWVTVPNFVIARNP
jgi:mannan endo-1,4-beta-mannosidase